MISIGCIQAQYCHKNTYPTGITTHNECLQAGINIKDKAERVNFYIAKFKNDLLEKKHTFGYENPLSITWMM
jgi:glutamate synthase domain-containing protein 2